MQIKVPHYVSFQNNVRAAYGYAHTVKMQLHFVELATFLVRNSRLVVELHYYYPRDAMLARVIAIATCLSVRPYVCPSVCPSRAGIVSKRRKLAA